MTKILIISVFILLANTLNLKIGAQINLYDTYTL